MNRQRIKQLLQQIADAHSGILAELEGESTNQAAATPARPLAPLVIPAAAEVVGTGFVWGKRSKAELEGVRRELVECATLALMKYSRIDFMCFDGLRTREEQARHVRNGVSRTMNSKHLIGDAVDLVPIIDGVPKWDWDGCYEVACAMDAAATELGYSNRIVWGGAWDRTLADYGGDAKEYAAEVQRYRQRNPGKTFVDGPHFEWR